MESIVKVNGKPYEQVQDYSVDYNQTWAAGSERDFGGTWNGTVLGNFDSVKFVVMPKNKAELSALITDLRADYISVEYYDFEIAGMKTKTFYRANFSVKAIYISALETYVDLVQLSFVPERKN